MKTAIIYTSKHGTTERVACAMADKLRETDEVTLFSLKKDPNPNISAFDRVILGAPVYAGNISAKMKTFCKANEAALLQKRTGLFVCGMDPSKEKQEEELKNAYPQELFTRAKATAFLGGAFLFEQMNFFERAIIKKIAKTTTSVHQVDGEAVDGFIEGLKQE